MATPAVPVDRGRTSIHESVSSFADCDIAAESTAVANVTSHVRCHQRPSGSMSGGIPTSHDSVSITSIHLYMMDYPTIRWIMLIDHWKRRRRKPGFIHGCTRIDYPVSSLPQCFQFGQDSLWKLPYNNCLLTRIGSSSCSSTKRFFKSRVSLKGLHWLSSMTNLRHLQISQRRVTLKLISASASFKRLVHT